MEVRNVAKSRAEKWRGPQLQARFGDGYLYMREFGNINYNRPGPIELNQPEIGVCLAGKRLQYGQHLAFMCMCPQAEGCHRQVAAQAMEKAFPSLSIVHL